VVQLLPPEELPTVINQTIVIIPEQEVILVLQQQQQPETAIRRPVEIQALSQVDLHLQEEAIIRVVLHPAPTEAVILALQAVVQDLPVRRIVAVLLPAPAPDQVVHLVVQALLVLRDQEEDS
jgi:hypothetical protein